LILLFKSTKDPATPGISIYLLEGHFVNEDIDTATGLKATEGREGKFKERGEGIYKGCCLIIEIDYPFHNYIIHQNYRMSRGFWKGF